MKKLLIVLVVAFLILGSGVGYAIHRQNVSRYCNQAALKEANSKVPIFYRVYQVTDNRNAYNTFYTQCIRSH